MSKGDSSRFYISTIDCRNWLQPAAYSDVRNFLEGLAKACLSAEVTAYQ